LNDKLPVLLIGDFNAAAGNNKAFDILAGDGFFRDTWDMTENRTGEGYGTFNGFQAVQKNGARIDWVLIRGLAHVHSADIVLDAPNGVFPSDHFPVVARISFPVESAPAAK
jgi:endonuclease/exonuclease/phosphatase family metal-dependent hydrolase